MKETLRTTMRMKWLAALLVLGTWATTSTAQVTVTATAGTPGPTSYTTLNDAFAAINAGTHQGDVVVAIGANTTETGPCVLNSSGAGSAVYTTVNIHPTADGVSVSGPTTTGRGLIELNGADNVTIDGDNPNTGGTNRNLSIINTAANTVTLTSCIRLATSAAVTSADNNAVKNLILTGSATGRNVAGTASTTGSENNTFGIVISGNAGATASGPPVAITSETGTAPSGTTVNALLLDNNEINACARGIVFSGANAAVSSGVTISNNIIGGAGTLTGNAPFTGVTTTVYTKGIWVAGTTAVSVTGNTLRNILSYVSPINITGIELASAIGTGTISIQNNTINGLAENNTASAASAPKAILISNAGAPYTIANNTVTNVQWAGYSFTASQVLVGIELNTTAASATVERNKVSKIYNNNTNTLGVYGINVAGGNNISIYNNFVSDILNDMTGGVAFSTQYGLFGIRINAGTGHKINYNTVSLSGTRFGTPASSLLSAALCIVATARTGLEVKNNILSNTITGGTTSIAEVALYLPSGGTSGMNLTLNNNYYYSGTDAARQGIAQVSTTSSVANLYQASNFNPAAITPTTNLRAYTSTLSAAGTNDNASGASTAAAPFVSSTDLHINNLAVNATDLDGKGAVIAGITTDIDGAVRNASTPDIGADEFDLPPCSAANGGTITPTTYTRCQAQTVSLASTGATTGSGITYQWKAGATPGGPYLNVPGGTGANTTSYTSDALPAGTFYAVLEVTCANGPITGLSNEVTVVVNPLPTVTVSPSSATYCSPGAAVTLTAAGASTYTWSPASGLSATTGSSVDATPTVTNTYTVVGTDANTCSASATATVVSSVGVAGATATATPSTVCPGGTVTLGASASAYQTTIFAENFNSGAAAWTRVNNSVGGTPANAAWTERPSGYVYGTNTFTSNDASQFIMSNSDAQDVVSGSTTSTQLISPAFSTVGITGLNLKFFHFYRHVAASDSATVEASTDGTNWTFITSYKVTTGAAGTFAAATLALPVGFENQPAVYVRFRYTASWAWYWVLDNVSVTGASTSFTYSWSSIPAGYSSNLQNPTANVPVAADFIAAITNSNGCVASDTVSVAMLPAVGTVTATSTAPAVCAGGSVNLGASITGGTTIILAENFNSGASNWTRVNNSTGGTPALTAWLDQPDAYVYDGNTFHSNDLTQFIMSNSDAGAGGSLTNTTITSPAFSTTGLSNISIEFYHHYRFVSNDSGVVEVSLDGTAWTSLATYKTTVGSANAFTFTSLALPAPFENQPTVYVRFRYDASWDWYWAVDNFSAVATTTFTYAWSSNPAGFTSTDQNPTGVIPTATTDYTVTVTNTSGCTGTATVNVAYSTLPLVAVTPSSATYCNPGTPVSLTASGASTYTWAPGAGLSATTGASVDATPSATTTYTVTGTDANGCTATAQSVITSNPAVTGATATASASPVCAGSPFNLNSSANPTPGAVILSENFNSGAPNWVRVNNSTGGTPLLTAWLDMADGSVVSSNTFHSNDNSQFVMSNSDAGGSGSLTNTRITSPAFSTVGFSNITINYFHHYRFVSNDSGVVEVSLDGTTWTRLVSYKATTGTAGTFAAASLALPAPFENQPTVYVRFRYDASWDWYWALDNVSVNGSSTSGYTYSWSSVPAGFTSTDQNPTGVTATTTTDYTVTITNLSGCSSTATVNMVVNPAPAVTVTPANASLCSPPATPVTLTASGANTYTWSPASGLSATTGVSVDASPSTVTTYTVVGTDGNGCTASATATVTPTTGISGAAATATPSAVCAGVSSVLNVTTTPSPSTILTENFNTGSPNWVRDNFSTGGTPANAKWSDRPDGYVYGTGTPYHSNDSSQFVQSNSDAQGSGSTTLTSLTSPAFSTTGLGGISVNFFHFYRYLNSGDSATVEASLDGTNWNIVRYFNATAGSEASFASATVALPVTYENQPTVYVRFRYKATWDWYWSLDNVSINASSVFYTYNWGSSPAGFTSTLQSPTVTPTTTTDYTVTVTNPATGCTATATTTVAVNPLPIVAIAPASATYCNPGPAVTLTASGADTYVWSPATDLSATTGTAVDATPTQNRVYTVIGTDANGCTASATASVNSSNAVINAGASASSTTICQGDTIDLTSSGASQQVIFSEDFNTGATNWTRVNNSTGGTPASAAWTNRPDGYIYTSFGTPYEFHSNDNTAFELTNSDIQGSGSTTSTILASPAFSTTGLTNLSLQFYHHYLDLGSSDTAIVEASIDGTNWSIVQQYTDDEGLENDFVMASVALPSTYDNQPVVNIRFRYKGVWAWWWAIDNVTVSGAGNANLTYNWSSNPAGFTSTDANPADVVPAGSTDYTVTITDVGGCSATASVSVTVNPTPTVTASASAAAVCAGEQVTLTGGGATTYAWSDGVTDGVAFAPNATDTYTVTGTDGNGCSATASVSITVNPVPVVTATASDNEVCAGEQVTLTGGGATTYAWSGGVSDGVAFAPNATDTYTVTGTDGNGCSATASVSITVNPVPVVTATASDNEICAGEQVTLTGGGAATYAWSGGVTDGTAFAPNATDTYTVTGTDGNGCSATASVTVTVNNAPTVTATASDADLCAGEQVTLTGGGAATYVWSGGVTDGTAFAPNATDTYTVTGTDGNGCSATASVTVTVNTAPTVTATASDAEICAGEQVTLTGSGAATYAWSGGVTDGVAFAPNATDTYTVTGSDGNGCSATASVSVTVNASPTVTANTSASSVCAGEQVTFTGGGATTYAWSGGVTDGVGFTPNATDTYTVTGTDNGCSATASVTVTVNPIPTVTASASASSVCAGEQVTLTGGGATTYAWSGGVTDGTAFAPNATDTYTVTGTSNGCSATASVTVTVNNAPAVTATASSASVCAGGQVTLTGGGATTYTWSGGVTDGTAFTPNATDTYTVTGTENGCSATASVTVTVNDVPVVTATASVSAICAGDQVTLTGGGATTYAWSGGVTDGVVFTPNATDTYTVTGTSNGCSATATVTVTVNAAPTVTLTLPTDTAELNGGTITLSGGSPAGGVYSGTGVTGTTFNPTVNGLGTVIITYTASANGCSASATGTITVVNTVGIASVSALSGVQIFPNPTQGQFVISLVAPADKEVNVEITDATGKLVNAFVMTRQIQDVNIDTYAAGVYFVRLASGDSRSTHRIIKQ